MSDQLTKTNLSRLATILADSTKGFVEAGEIVANVIDSAPDEAVDYICGGVPGLTSEIVLCLERLGRKTLHPQLLLADGPGVKRLRKLSYSYQEKFVKEPISVVLRSEAGQETLRVDILNLTESQAQQVFASDHVRSEGEQRAWIEDATSKAIPVQSKVNLPYRVAGNKLVVMIAGTTFTRKELARLLSDME